MIDEPRLRDGLARLLTATEDNIRDRCDEEPAVNEPLKVRYESARKAGRTGLTFNIWRDNEITQAGVAWLLACVFVRFLEDNDLLGEVYIAGPDGRTKSAQERLTHWYRANVQLSHREYLLDIFSEIVRLPGMKGLLDRDHNPLWSLGPDGDGAKAIVDFFQSVDRDTGLLLYDFTDSAHSTRFLGDLYQNISNSARKLYALLQTPDFVVDFILDRTLTPALDEFGLDGMRLIDPACGSGHFLLTAFDRLHSRWSIREGELVVSVQNTLDCLYGVDLNPYAIAIARFRLLIAALRASRIRKLAHAPDWQIHLATGDSLLLGPKGLSPYLSALPTENPDALQRYLRDQNYRVVVGNPPYINVDDDDLRDQYRKLYTSCYKNYQICVPFIELFFDSASAEAEAGFIGLITSSAFMQKDFGKKLIERHFPAWDITHIVDSSVANLEGHGTSTAILLARNRSPVGKTVRLVSGIAEGGNQAWEEIDQHTDESGYVGSFVNVLNVDRAWVQKHPCAISGGNTRLIGRIEQVRGRLKNQVRQIGRAVVLGADEAWVLGSRRCSERITQTAELVIGKFVRDWCVIGSQRVVYPYSSFGGPVLSALPAPEERWLWPNRLLLSQRKIFKQTLAERDRPWFDFLEHYRKKLRSPLSITFPFIATHSTFVLDRGGKLFNRHAPLIKLRAEASETDHLQILGILNSSVAAYWLRHKCKPKDGGTKWDNRFEYDASKLKQFPLPTGRPLEITTSIQSAGDERATLLPAALIAREFPTRASLAGARERAEALLVRMVALQEELDWHVYHLYGLLEESLTLSVDQVPRLRVGERAFEMLMARAIESKELETEWFARHRATPRTTVPEDWPPTYRALVQRRLDTIARDRDIAVIEQPEYKRRWDLPPWEKLEKEALREWLLDRLEGQNYWSADPPVLTSIARLADAVRRDAEFLQVAELYRHRADFDLTELVEELVTKESVPFLPILRYKESGMRNRADWENTWQLQRRQDAGERVEILVPPKYEKNDFVSADSWQLRGKLDVPKERFISYSPLVRDTDKSLVIAWAGYDHGQQALALARYYNDMRGNEGWDAERLTPILAGLQELQPWLDQWHNEMDLEKQQRLNEFVLGFVEGELTQLSLTAEQVHAWRPTAQASRAGRKKKR